MLDGYFAAAVTPFNNYRVDIASFEKYIDFLISSGISGIIVCGTTGESTALSYEEKLELMTVANRINSGRIKLIAGIMDPITETCIKLIKDIEDIVDGFLCICPYYVRPSQNQLYKHFETISKSTEKEIVVYNAPHRTGISIEFNVFKKLCDLNNFIGIKDCSCNLDLFTSWRIKVDKRISFLSGNDDIACAALAMGASGVISVSANIAPSLCSELYSSFKNSDLKRFCELRDMLSLLHEAMFIEPSPGPVKYALFRLGFIKNELRNPLSIVGNDTMRKIDEIIEMLSL